MDCCKDLERYGSVCVGINKVLDLLEVIGIKKL